MDDREALRLLQFLHARAAEREQVRLAGSTAVDKTLIAEQQTLRQALFDYEIAAAAGHLHTAQNLLALLTVLARSFANHPDYDPLWVPHRT